MPATFVLWGVQCSYAPAPAEFKGSQALHLWEPHEDCV